MDLETDQHPERELRSFFAEVHRRPAPTFRRLWRAARETPRRSPRLPIPRFAIAGGLLAGTLLVVIAWTIFKMPEPEKPAIAGSVVELSAIETLTEWQGPLDFLLRTPGRELLETAPSFALELPTVSIETDLGTERRFEYDT